MIILIIVEYRLRCVKIYPVSGTNVMHNLDMKRNQRVLLTVILILKMNVTLYLMYRVIIYMIVSGPRTMLLVKENVLSTGRIRGLALSMETMD